MKYFGPPHLRKLHEMQIATPLHMACGHCGERFADGDIGTIDLGGTALHYECGMRLVIGSVGHQKKQCVCYGREDEDPPGMTKREAARAALRLFEQSASDAHKKETTNGN
jgi:hypothetical protein